MSKRLPEGVTPELFDRAYKRVGKVSWLTGGRRLVFKHGEPAATAFASQGKEALPLVRTIGTDAAVIIARDGQAAIQALNNQPHEQAMALAGTPHWASPAEYLRQNLTPDFREKMESGFEKEGKDGLIVAREHDTGRRVLVGSRLAIQKRVAVHIKLYGDAALRKFAPRGTQPPQEPERPLPPEVQILEEPTQREIRQGSTYEGSNLQGVVDLVRGNRSGRGERRGNSLSWYGKGGRGGWMPPQE